MCVWYRFFIMQISLHQGYSGANSFISCSESALPAPPCLYSSVLRDFSSLTLMTDGRMRVGARRVLLWKENDNEFIRPSRTNTRARTKLKPHYLDVQWYYTQSVISKTVQT